MRDLGGSPPSGLTAFDDPEFLKSRQARTLRVLAELLEPQYRLAKEEIEDTIVFFGSSRVPGPDDDTHHAGLAAMQPYYQAARELARRLTEWRLEGRRFLICTGAGPGIMEAANRGAVEGGGRTIGFAINLPNNVEPPNPYVTPDLHFEFHYFFVRKFWFIYNAKALLVFPGGYGTMDELTEVLTLVQTGKVTKKMGIVLYGANFWNDVINFDALLRHGVISQEDRELFVIVDSVDEAFDRVCSFLKDNYGPSLLEESDLPM
jgi:uncharacterized protein (TIGR00730 family)